MVTRSRSLSIVALGLIVSCVGACSGSSPSPTTPVPVAAFCPNPPKGTFTLNTGETLRLSFTTPPVPTADVIVIDPGIRESHGTLSWTLSNGTTVLGVKPTDGYWKSNSSLLSSSLAPVIDFSSIVNGTISGRGDIAVVNGSASFDLSAATVAIAHAGTDARYDVLTNPPITLALISTACR